MHFKHLGLCNNYKIALHIRLDQPTFVRSWMLMLLFGCLFVCDSKSNSFSSLSCEQVSMHVLFLFVTILCAISRLFCIWYSWIDKNIMCLSLIVSTCCCVAHLLVCLFSILFARERSCVLAYSINYICIYISAKRRNVLSTIFVPMHYA